MSKLANNSKQIVPLLEELTYFLEQYNFTPSMLTQVISMPATQTSYRKRLEDDFSASSDDASSGESRAIGPAYDYETLCMIMTEARSFGMSLKLGMDQTAWLSATASVNSVVLRWLTDLYRIPPHLSASFVDDLSLARQNILRTALRTHFPTHATQGYRAFGAANPIVLCTHLVSWVSTLVSDVGLPQDAIRVGPLAMDQLSSNDVVVAVIWVLPDPTEPITWNEAQTDALIAFVEKKAVWLHAEGHDTILMTSLPDHKSNIVASIADSLIVDPSELLQVERFPQPTLFYRVTPRQLTTPTRAFNTAAQAGTAGTSSNFVAEALQANAAAPTILVQSGSLHLELWFAAQLKGYKFLSNLVAICDSLCDQLYRRIGTCSSLVLLESNTKSNTTLHIRYENPKKSASSEDQTKPKIDPVSGLPVLTWPDKSYHSPPEDDEKVTEYLYQVIKNTFATPVPLELSRLSADGKLYLMWNPLKCYHAHHLTPAIVTSVGDLLVKQAVIITSTLACRPVFVQEVSKIAAFNLLHTNPTNYVGLGALRYRPDFVTSVESDAGKQADGWNAIVDDLNSDIFNELSQVHQLYYLADATDGRKALGLHLDSSEMTVEKLQYHIQLLHQTAARFEQESHFLDRIGALVKEGIKEAKETIERSKQQRANEKGVVRALPIVGRVVNWWSPFRPTASSGTSYDLLSASQKASQ